MRYSMLFGALLLAATLVAAAPSAQAQTAPAERKADIIYQTYTYTPPFYLGKALPSGENAITAVAYPNLSGTSLNAAELYYKWILNGEALPEFSGTGKRLASFNTPLASGQTLLEVEVADPKGGYRARGAIYINDHQTKALLYEKSPLLGTLFNRVIPDTFLMKEPEATFFASPLFFSTTRTNNSGVDYKWSMNGVGEERSSTLTVRAGEGQGTASISVSLTHALKYTQSASRSFFVSFGNQNATN